MVGRSASLWAGTLLLIATAYAASPPFGSEAPRQIVQMVRQAVEADSAAAFATELNRRIQRNPNDHVATLGLATLARLTYDYDAAAKQYHTIIAYAARTNPHAITTGPRTHTTTGARRVTASIAARPATLTDSLTTYALLGLAWQADTRGMFGDADSLFVKARAAARVSKDPAAEAEAMLGWALERGPIDGAAVALAIVDSASKLIPPTDLELRAEAGVRRAVLLAVLSNPATEREAREARTLAQEAKAPRLEAKAIGARALNYLLHGESEQGLVLYDTVVALQRRARDYSALAETLYRQADILRGRGELGAFKQRAIQAAREAERSHNDIVGRSVLVGLGALSLFVHDYVSADRYLSKAVERQKADGAVEELMLSRAHRAKLYYAIGDIDKARAETEAVAEYHKGTGDGAYELSALRDLIAIELRANQIPAAERVLHQAEGLVRRLKVKAWNRDLAEDRGAVALAKGDLAGAQREFTFAFSLLDTARHVARHAMRVRLAQVFALRGNLAAAERELVSADDELDRWRATLTDRELRVLTYQTGATEQNNRNESLATTIALLARGGYATQALQIAERRRARELTDRVLQAQALAETSGPASSVTSAVAQHKASFGGLLAAIPNRQTAVLEYVTGAHGAPTTLFVLTRGTNDSAQIRGYVLPSSDSLAPLIDRFVGLIEAGEDPTMLATSLGQSLLAPAAEIFEVSSPKPITHLVIIPDGPLHVIPFDALRLSDGKFVVERFATSLAPSNGVIAALRSRGATRTANNAANNAATRGQPAKKPDVRILVFGDPTFESATSGKTKSTASSSPTTATLTAQPVSSGSSSTETLVAVERGDNAGYTSLDGGEPGSMSSASAFEALPRLTGSADEAEIVARYGDRADIRLRDRATAAYLKTAPLHEFQILHFATHALVDERTVARTALALAPSDGQSGFVSPGELSALSLNADLVVLSACQTAGGVVVDGEGVQGLTSSFLEAGAQSVVASRWRIGDQSTVEVVQDFYDALSQKLPVAEALREAKLAALRRGAPARDWAAFTVVGDPYVTIPLDPPGIWENLRGRKGVRVIIVGLIGALGMFWLIRKNRRVA